MTRALVLGATGHIGAHVVRALLSKGYAVRASYRNPRYQFLLEGLPIERMQVEVEDAAQLGAALDGCDVVFMCAGYYPRLTERRSQAVQRGIGQIHRAFDVLTAGRAQRIVYTSSAATIAPVSGREATEADQEPWPLTDWRALYATVKIAMEHAVRQYADRGAPIVVVNPSICIGEYDARPFSGRLVLLYGRRRGVPVYLEHRFNVVYTGDVGLGHVLAAERGRPGERYLLTGRNLTLREFTRLVAREAGVAPPRWNVPYPLAMAAAAATELAAAITRTEPLFSRCVVQHARFPRWLDGSKARRELGIPQTPIEEAIRRSLAWFRRHGYL
jgi:dihydroflavonol-4-reductase